MFKIIFYLLITVILISVVRSVAGIIVKAFATALQPERPATPRANGPASVPLTGELKRDPVCGTYISAASSLRETVGRETFHFCSPTCRDKYVASLAR